MSEFTTAPVVTLEDLGLDIDSPRGVTVRTPFRPNPRSPEGTIEVTGKRGTDSIEASGREFSYILDGGLGRNGDVLSGGRADDVIIGRKGADTLAGGRGSDTFVFNNRDTPRQGDTIVDFESRDTILLDGRILRNRVDPGRLPRSELAVVRRNRGNASTEIDAALIYEQRTGNIFFNRTNRDGGDKLLITLENVPEEISNRNFEIF